MKSTPEVDTGYCEGHKYMKAGSASSPEVAMMTNDVSISTNILQISAEAIALAAGAAGTTGTACLDKAPIFDAVGAQIGCIADTSFAWVTGTVLTTEVAWDYKLSDAAQLALMANGEYRIDYRSGKILYKKATADVGDTCNYKTRQLNIEITASAAPTLGSVKVEDATTAANKADVNPANTARAVTTKVIAVQHVDAAGRVLQAPPLGAAAAAASTPVTLATDDAHLGALGAAADADGNIHGQLRYIADAIDALEGKEFYKVVATGVGALALSSAAAHIWELNSITVHFDMAPATSEFLTFTLDSTDGAAYDTMLFKCDPSAVVGTDFVFTPDTPLLMAAGDEICIAFANSDGRTYGARIVGKKLA